MHKKCELCSYEDGDGSERSAIKTAGLGDLKDPKQHSLNSFQTTLTPKPGKCYKDYCVKKQ